MIAPDGIPHVARFLANHPDGVLPGSAGAESGNGFDFRDLINKCEHFVELTGDIGDVSGPFLYRQRCGEAEIHRSSSCIR
jgi:hypothetical protein